MKGSPVGFKALVFTWTNSKTFFSCLSLIASLWLKFPIRKQNEFQSWDENTFWDCNFMLQMLHSECYCGVPSWEKKRLCNWGEKAWASCFQWATQIHFEFSYLFITSPISLQNGPELWHKASRFNQSPESECAVTTLVSHPQAATISEKLGHPSLQHSRNPVQL